MRFGDVRDWGVTESTRKDDESITSVHGGERRNGPDANTGRYDHNLLAEPHQQV